jgi:hypothetical protein
MNNHSTVTIIRPSTNHEPVARVDGHFDGSNLLGLVKAKGQKGDLVHFGGQWHRWTGNSLVVHNKRLPRKVKELVSVPLM